MMPLWTTAIVPETCGWALRSEGHAVGRPARVGDAGDGGWYAAEAASSSATRPTERMRSMPVPPMTASPAES